MDFHYLSQVRDWYLDSFRDLRCFPEIMDTKDELEFTQMLKIIKVRHNNIIPIMALGVQQLKKSLDPKINYEVLDEIQQFLDRFYMSRIGIRMLIDLRKNYNFTQNFSTISNSEMPMQFVCANMVVHLTLIFMGILVLHTRMFQHIYILWFLSWLRTPCVCCQGAVYGLGQSCTSYSTNNS
ncbi:hypothetical protein CsSME_00031386 [Camellia sinensis var. sinensis]